MSEPIVLSAEQRAVVHATDSLMMVTAAAGAGKTEVLSQRFLRHVVEEDLRPDQILTITFTRKAAAKMKERIVKRLHELGRHADAQVAETGPIQTIHSFCERMLRENSLEAGLDPQFEILSESQTSRLITACVREALASPLDDAPQAEALLTFLAGKRPAWGENKSPYGVLEEAVNRVLQELRGSGLSQLQIQQWHLDPRTLRDKWEELMLGEVSPEARAAFANVEAPSFQEALQQAVKAVGQRVPPWLKNRPDPMAELEALEHTCGLVQLACAAWWRLDREMDANQALDFSALEERAVRLLARSQPTQERMRAQYRVVMIDEAQDLNPIQYQLLDAIVPDRLMLVGDAQQSIYSFRQADVKLFENRVAKVGSKRLSRNYRSDAGILNFVDFVFGSLWSQKYTPMGAPAEIDLDVVDSGRDFSGVEIWRQASNDMDAVATYVQELHAEGIPYRDITVLVRDAGGARAIETGLKQAGVPHRVAGGSEKFYTRLEVRDLANALRAVADPYDDFSLLACLRSPLCGLSLDSIVLLGTERPVVERLATFEPPVADDIPRLQAFLAWYEPLRHIADRLSAWEVLAELFAKSDLLPALARRNEKDALLANVRKLLSLAAKEPELGPLEYAERIREIQDLRHKEGDAPADEDDADLVTVMTVHKAKGLEFPVVILPQTDKRIVANARELVVEPRRGVVATKFGKGQCTMHKLLTEGRKARDEEEEMRVLYVALTRAKHRLCLCLYPPKRDRTISKLFDEMLGEVPPAGVRVRDTQDLSKMPV
ncbi:MAG: UvrD-helicase domain-containing protein [Fimbriimonas sp.]